MMIKWWHFIQVPCIKSTVTALRTVPPRFRRHWTQQCAQCTRSRETQSLSAVAQTLLWTVHTAVTWVQQKVHILGAHLLGADMGEAHSSECGLRPIKRRRAGKGGDAHPLFSIIIISHSTHWVWVQWSFLSGNILLREGVLVLMA